MEKGSSDQIEWIEARVTDLVIRLTILGFFVYWSLALVRPFLPIAIWAVVLAVALAPIHDSFVRRLGGRRGLASVILTVLALLVVIGPVAALAKNLVETIQDFVIRSNSGALKLPRPPELIRSLPIIGERIEAFWVLAITNTKEVFVRYHEVLAPARAFVISGLSSVSFDLVKFIVSIIVAGALLVPGPRLAAGARRIAARIIAPRGEQFVVLAAATIRNVSRGVVGISLLQAVLIGIVLQFAGLAGAGMLTFIILLLCVVQIGPGLVTVPVLIWAWVTMETGPALLMTVVLIPLTVMDNVLKPLLMRRGLTTPTVVIFLGVVGGALTYGMIGLFLGPVVLAVFYDLALTWTIVVQPPSRDQSVELSK